MTTDNTSTQVSAIGSASPRSAPARRRSSNSRGKLILLAVLTVLAICLGGRAFRHSDWYQERRMSAMSLAQLQNERAGRLDNPRLLYYIGVRLSEQSRFLEADAYLRNAVGLDPDDPRLRDAWAQALVRTGQITDAFGELRQFAGTHPNLSGAHLDLGKFYLTQASLVRASEELRRSVEIEPSLGEGWSYLASAESGLGHIVVAEEASEHAVALRPGNATDRLGLALLLLELGKTERARHAFAEAVALDPRSPATHREYARCLLKLGKTPGDFATAETEVRQALVFDAQDPAATRILGQVLVAEGRGNDAIAFLETAARHSPYDPVSALAVAQTYRRLRQDKQASLWNEIFQERSRHVALKADLITTIQRDPRNRAPQQRLARLLAEEGDVGGCLRHEAAGLHRSTDSPPSLVAAANDLNTAGRSDAALPLAQKAVGAAMNNPMAREALGNSLLGLGQPYQAADAYARAAHGLPERAPHYQKLLDEYYQQHVGHLPRRSTPHQADVASRTAH